jgi:hypothetical protein
VKEAELEARKILNQNSGVRGVIVEGKTVTPFWFLELFLGEFEITRTGKRWLFGNIPTEK